MRSFGLLLLFTIGCSNNNNGGGSLDAPSGACASISCNVTGENLCDDYTTATPTQCADVPTACAARSGTVANPAACPTAGFTAKCAMPGPGGYVLRFYGSRGGASDMSFCTTTATGTWSTTF